MLLQEVEELNRMLLDKGFTTEVLRDVNKYATEAGVRGPCTSVPGVGRGWFEASLH